MTFKNAVTFVVTSVCALLVTTSCSSTHVHHRTGRRVGHGPPPHAPAHGHRHKHVHGVELVFDSGLGLYVVVGHPDHYYCDGHFYRLAGGVWQMSLRFDRGWAHTSGKPLPSGLRAKVKATDNAKSRNPGRAVVSRKASDNSKSGNPGRAVGSRKVSDNSKSRSQGKAVTNVKATKANDNGKSKNQGKAVAKGKGKNKGR
ncbi:MAG: hypothetical protein ACYSWQ_06355 [Planctomycetota bacterium]